MTKLDIFNYESYKAYLKDYIQLHQRRGIVSELAEAAGCDRTYFSQVLGSKVQLTPDHAFALTTFLNLTEPQEDYFVLTVLLERAATPGAKTSIKRKLAAARHENQNLSKKIKSIEIAGELTEKQRNKYYSSWMVSAIHILTSSKEHQTIESIADRLGIKKTIVREILNDLINMGLVKVSEGHYRHASSNIHISRGTAHNTLNHLNWRTKALESTNKDDGIHYSHVFTISKKDWPKLKDSLLAYIENQRESIQRSGSEELYTFCCDLFAP